MLSDYLKRMYYESYQKIGDFRRKKQTTKWTKSHVTKELDKDCRDKAISYYSPYTKINPLFHSFYTEKTGVFCEIYIPDDIYYTKIDTYYNNWQSAKILDNKCFYERMFISDKIKHPDSLLYRMNNVWLNSKNEMLSRDEINLMLEKEDELVVKQAVDSEGGKGVFFITNCGNNFADKFWKAIEPIKKDIVVQRPIKQHKDLSTLNSSSVNTIRILSLLTEEGPKIYSCIVRMGIGKARVDNASSGGITCGINENGELKNVAYAPTGKKFLVHPTNNIHFEEVTIPSFALAKEAILELHPQIEYFA